MGHRTTVILAVFNIGFALCMIEQDVLPPFLKKCLLMKTEKQSVLEAPSESVCNTCVTRYLWLEGPSVEECDFKNSNLTVEEISKFVGKVLCDEMPGRRKRQAWKRKGCLRKEYRTLTRIELNRFHTALNKAYRSGYFGWVARFHSKQIKTTAHGGPNFFGYHRFLLLILEKILQYFDIRVCLPYWDSSIDSNMDRPENSVVWSSQYFGKGHGVVDDGPFAGWKDASGNSIVRNLNNGGSLFTINEIKTILNMPTIYVLSEPSPYVTLESFHDDCHNYVGGTMLPVQKAPWDPVFWLHHCFVDYLWEVWRYNHGYNTEYPIYGEQREQHPDLPMKNMPYIHFIGRVPRNKDGYSRELARQAYYQLTPTCTRDNPDCGSRSLQCRLDKDIPVCCAVDRMFQRETQPLFNARHYQNVNVRHSRRGKRDTEYSFSFKSDDIDKIYIPREHEPCMGEPIQNTFIADCSTGVKKYAMLPIKVIHVRPNEARFSASAFDHGPYDIYDEHKYRNLNYFVHPDNPATYEDCKEDDSGAFRVRIKSTGISYFGQYVDYVVCDNRLPISSHIGYIGIERPTDNKMTRAFITASDACGRLCKATCLRREGNNVYYEPCSGAIKVSTRTPLMYGNDFGEAVLSIWKFNGYHTPQEQESNIFMVFYCDYSNAWPWPECNKK